MKGLVVPLALCCLFLGSSKLCGANKDLNVEGPPYEPLPQPLPFQQSKEAFGIRSKRDVKGELFDAAESLGIGEKYLKKFRSLVEGVPPKMQDALIAQDFSNVTESDVRALNISVLEYLPPKLLKKLNVTHLSPIIERLLVANRPNALGRVMTAMGDKMDSNTILDKLKSVGGISDSNEEASSVLLYTALSRVGDKNELNQQLIRRLSDDGLLSLVPEEQLMKITDPNAARGLLHRMYKYAGGSGSGPGGNDREDLTDVDDQALIYSLAETGYGKAETWSSDTLRQLGTRIMGQLPAAFLKDLSPDFVSGSIATLRETKWETPLQAKAVADAALKKMQDPKVLGPLAAFANPESGSTDLWSAIVSGSDQLNLPAPLKAVSGLLKEKGRPVKDWRYEDFRGLTGPLLKNSPPAVIAKGMEERALDERQLREIGGGNTQNGYGGGKEGAWSNLFQGIISQVSSYAINFFTRGGRVDFSLPGAFLGALGIKGINDMSNRDLNDDVLDKLKTNPDSLDDAQKAMLLKRLKDAGMIDSVDLPPEIRSLQPRDPRTALKDDALKGLPSDHELRLAFGGSRTKVTATELEKNPYLVGTLTPAQVASLELEELPAVLSVIRKSKDGPGAQTLAALAKRYADYIREKSEDYESPDKKLLKYVSAGEISKIPGSVLAYFVDARQTAKLPADVRKEIMIAMGELGSKDAALVPTKTREEIILQGLDAIDKLTSGESKKNLGVAELAALGVGVADLPPERIKTLSPVALEQALELIEGVADDDDDGLRVRACLSPDQRKAWRSKLLEAYGPTNKWDTATTAVLCCALGGLLDEDDLVAIAPEALATCSCVADARPPSHLAELKAGLEAACRYSKGQKEATRGPSALAKVKAETAFDLDDLESQIIVGRRRKRESSESLTCFKVRLAGSAAHFTKDQLDSLEPNEMSSCLYELGSQPLPLEHARLLWGKLVKSKPGGVENLGPQDLRYAGHLLAGIKLSDVVMLNLRNWDIVFPFGAGGGPSKNVLESLAKNLEEKQGKPVGQFNGNDLIVTRNILCGFPTEQLGEIRSEAFRDALPILKSLDSSCEHTRLSALAVITTRPEIFGDASKWSPADVRGVGILLAGLPLRVIKSIPGDAFNGVSPSVAIALPPQLLEGLSAAQVAALPAFSAQAMADSQGDALGADAREEFDKIRRGPAVSKAGLRSVDFSIEMSILTAISLAAFVAII